MDEAAVLSMRPPAVALYGLTKTYEDKVAVNALNLVVPEGEFYGFLGPNGAGKTTMVRMLTTLLMPTGGQALVADHDVARDPHRAADSGGGLRVVRAQFGDVVRPALGGRAAGEGEGGGGEPKEAGRLHGGLQRVCG